LENFILACRYYNCAAVIHSYFMSHLDNPAIENVGLEAINHFDESIYTLET